MSSKEHIVWFIKVDHVESWAASAKMKQMHEWIKSNKPFGDNCNLVLVPSDENKISFLKTETDIRKDFQNAGEDLDQWLCNIKDMLEDCLTVHLQYKKRVI